jgi:hypothetical protein
MRTRHAGLTLGIACLAALVVVGSVVTRAAGPAEDAADPHACAALVGSSEDPSPRADCCFTNRAFSGVCRVKPGENETCATILAYLNDPRSQGKAYCGGTTIRSGWQQVSCDAPPPSGPVETATR